MVELGSCFLMMAPIAHQQLWRCKGLPVSLHWVFHNNMNNWAWLKTIKLWFRTWKKHCLFVYICGFVHVWVPYNLDYRLEIKHGRRENASYYIYIYIYIYVCVCIKWFFHVNAHLCVIFHCHVWLLEGFRGHFHQPKPFAHCHLAAALHVKVLSVLPVPIYVALHEFSSYRSLEHTAAYHRFP